MAAMRNQSGGFGGPQLTEEQMQSALDQKSSGPLAAITAAVSLVGAELGVFIAAVAGAAVLHFLGTLLGGQQTFSQMLTATSWARLPLVFQEALRLVVFLPGGFDPNPSGLEGLVAGDPLQAAMAPSPLGPVLAQVSVWNLWKLALFVVAVRAVSQVSRGKAIAAIAVYLLLVVLLGEAGVLVGRFAAELAGGG
jgi:hypothetical protein